MGAGWCRFCRSVEPSGRSIRRVFGFRLRHGEEVGHEFEADSSRQIGHLARHGRNVLGCRGLPCSVAAGFL